MAEFEIPFKLKDSEYREVLLLEKYGDNYGITLAQEGQDGGTYKRWVYPQRREKIAGEKARNVPADKAIPLRVPLGNYQQAYAILLKMVEALKPPAARQHGITQTKDDDIPF